MLYVPRRSPLSYPAGRKAGFDVNHVASVGVRLSAVANGPTFLNLLTGKAGARAQTFVPGTQATIIGPLGQAVFPSALGDSVTFSGFPASIDANCTIAIIFMPYLTGGYEYYFTNSTNGAGQSLNINATANLQFTMFGVVAESSNIVVQSLRPYFIAVSQNGTSNINYLCLELDTGNIFTDTTASSTAILPDGNYRLFTDPANGSVGGGYMAAAMYSSNYMSMQQLRHWAADPWAFWYPRQRQNWTGPAATFEAAWARGSNISVVGAGTYH
jgi:hypothetical protein